MHKEIFLTKKKTKKLTLSKNEAKSFLLFLLPHLYKNNGTTYRLKKIGEKIYKFKKWNKNKLGKTNKQNMESWFVEEEIIKTSSSTLAHKKIWGGGGGTNLKRNKTKLKKKTKKTQQGGDEAHHEHTTSQ